MRPFALACQTWSGAIGNAYFLKSAVTAAVCTCTKCLNRLFGNISFLQFHDKPPLPLMPTVFYQILSVVKTRVIKIDNFQ